MTEIKEEVSDILKEQNPDELVKLIRAKVVDFCNSLIESKSLSFEAKGFDTTTTVARNNHLLTTSMKINSDLNSKKT